MPFNKRKIIYDNISDIKFSYYGWKDSDARMASLSELDFTKDSRPGWFSVYDGVNIRLHPQKLKIVIGEFSLEFTMPERARLNISREEIENPV